MLSYPESNSIHILLVEDEVMIAEETSMALRAMGYPNTVYANSYEEALVKVEERVPDLLLLDIDLGDAKDRDGIHLAARIQQDYTIPVIFLTQHPVSTFRGRLKDVEKVGYLTKSFNLDNLHAAIEVALDGMSQAGEASQFSEGTEGTLSVSGERFFIKEANRYRCFQMRELLFIQAHDSYCTLVFEHPESPLKVTLSINLKDVFQQINHPQLYRVHRSYAINLDKLTAFEGNMLFIQDVEIPVGPSFREALLSRLNILGRNK